MALPIMIVGWHVHPEAAVCRDCGQKADYLVAFEGDLDGWDLCSACLNGDRYMVKRDLIDEIFRKAGF